MRLDPRSKSCFLIFPVCVGTRTILERQVLRERCYFWIIFFYQLSEESNPGRLGGKGKRYLCALLSQPHPNPKVMKLGTTTKQG